MSGWFVCVALYQRQAHIVAHRVPVGKLLYRSEEHHESALSRLLFGLWYCCNQTVQSKLFSLRIAAFHHAIGVYDKGIPGFEHQFP